MKSLLVVCICLLMMSLLFPEGARASKFCFGVGTSKGAQFELNVSRAAAELTNARGGNSDLADAVYQRLDQSEALQGKFGTNYLVFHASKAPAADLLLVDEFLLRDGSTGIVKLVGSARDSFFCHEFP